jgi:hypothetical protein
MAAKNEELSQKYQQKTDKEHILANPDTYIGSVEEVDSDQWILDEETCSWRPPVPYPNDGVQYAWDEETQNWF